MLTVFDLRIIRTSLISVVGYKEAYLEIYEENLHLKEIDSLDRSILQSLKTDIKSFHNTLLKVENLIKKS